MNQKIPESSYDVIEALYFIHGKTIQEIAGAYDISYTTMRTVIQKIKKRRKIWRRQHGKSADSRLYFGD